MNVTKLMMWNIKIVLMICGFVLLVLTCIDLPETFIIFPFGIIILMSSGCVNPDMIRD